jgi:hypothetical protein
MDIGLMLEDSTGSFNWHLRGYLGFMLAGAKPEYKVSFAYMPSYEMNILGTQRDALYAGIGAWVEQKINNDFSLFANVNVNAGGNSWIYEAALGVNYKIGGNYAKIEISENVIKNQDDYKNRVSLVGRQENQPYKKTDKNIIVGAETQTFPNKRIDRPMTDSELYFENIRIEVEEQKFDNKVSAGDQVSREEELNHQQLILQLKAQQEKVEKENAARKAKIEAQKAEIEAQKAIQTQTQIQGQAPIPQRRPDGTPIPAQNRVERREEIISGSGETVIIRQGVRERIAIQKEEIIDYEDELDDEDMDDIYGEITTDEEDFDISPIIPAAAAKAKALPATPAPAPRQQAAAQTTKPRPAPITAAQADSFTEYESRSFKVTVCVFSQGSYVISKFSQNDIAAVVEDVKKYNYTKISIVINRASRRIDEILNENRARALYEQFYKSGIDIKKLDYINEDADTSNGNKGVVIIDYINQ